VNPLTSRGFADPPRDIQIRSLSPAIASCELKKLLFIRTCAELVYEYEPLKVKRERFKYNARYWCEASLLCVCEVITVQYVS